MRTSLQIVVRSPPRDGPGDNSPREVAPAGEQRADGPAQAVPKSGAAPAGEAAAVGQAAGTPAVGPVPSSPNGPGGQQTADVSASAGGAASGPGADEAGTDGTGTDRRGVDQTGQPVAKDAVAKDAVAKDAVAKDAVAKDAVAKDAVAKDAVAKDDGVSKHDKQWAFVRRALEVVVLGAAALFVLSRVNNVGSVAGAFDHLHWHWLFVGVGAEACSMVALAWMQHKLLRVGGLPVSVPDLVPVTLASNAVSLSLPAGTLFAEGYTFRQYQWLGASQVLAIWSQLSAGALATAALAAVAVAGAAIAPGLRLQLLPGLTFVLAGAVVAAALFRRAPLLGSLIGRTLPRIRAVPALLSLPSPPVGAGGATPDGELQPATETVDGLLRLRRPQLVTGRRGAYDRAPDRGCPGALERPPALLRRCAGAGGAADNAWWPGARGGWPGGSAHTVPRAGVPGHGGHTCLPGRELLAVATGRLVGRSVPDLAQPPGQPGGGRGRLRTN